MKKIIFTFSFILILTSFLLAQTVYVTKTGKKYHRSGCSFLKTTSSSISLQDAVDQGYTPCSRCNPPTLTTKPSKVRPTQNKVNSEKQNVSTGRCQAITKKGTQCKRQAEPGSKYCWQHQGYESSSNNIDSMKSTKEDSLKSKNNYKHKKK